MKIGPLNIVNSRRNGTRADPALSFQNWVDMLSYNGHLYQLGMSQTLRGDEEEIGRDFTGFVQSAYQSNGIVFACVVARMLLFSEARFQFRQLKNGRPGALFGTAALAKLETPWDGGTTGDLLSRMEQDVSLAGNFFGLVGLGITRLRPDWIDIMLGSKMDNAVWDPAAKVVAYVYTPGGRNSGEEPIVYLPENVVHYAPIPDPITRFRGMSWLQPILDEVQADNAATRFKSRFFNAGGTPNILVEFDKEVVKTVVDFDAWVGKIKEQLGDQANQHRALFLAGGTKGTVVGANLQEIEFKTTQGAGETRIALAARVPAVILGISEGLQGSSLNQGNYEMAMRQFVDLTMRPLWRNAAGSLAKAIQVPGGSELWYDDRDIPALHANARDAAEIDQIKAATIHTLITAGFKPDDVIAAVNAEWTKLAHTGLLSVQLTPMGSVGEGKGSLVSGTPVPTNGSNQP
jgi:hypothetical protein